MARSHHSAVRKMPGLARACMVGSGQNHTRRRRRENLQKWERACGTISRMKIRLPGALIGLMLMTTVSAMSQEIQRLDPALDKIVPPNAKLEKIAGGFDKWTEGPVWTRNGTLLFAEIPAN